MIHNQIGHFKSQFWSEEPCPWHSQLSTYTTVQKFRISPIFYVFESLMLTNDAFIWPKIQ